jgi:hypothetical protein
MDVKSRQVPREGAIRVVERGGQGKRGSVPPSALSLCAAKTGRRGGWARRRGADRRPACAPERWCGGYAVGQGSRCVGSDHGSGAVVIAMDFNFYVDRAGTQLPCKPHNLVGSWAGAVTLRGELASGGLCGPVNGNVRCVLANERAHTSNSPDSRKMEAITTGSLADETMKKVMTPSVLS